MSAGTILEVPSGTLRRRRRRGGPTFGAAVQGRDRGTDVTIAPGHRLGLLMAAHGTVPDSSQTRPTLGLMGSLGGLAHVGYRSVAGPAPTGTAGEGSAPADARSLNAMTIATTPPIRATL